MLETLKKQNNQTERNYFYDICGNDSYQNYNN